MIRHPPPPPPPCEWDNKIEHHYMYHNIHICLIKMGYGNRTKINVFVCKTLTHWCPDDVRSIIRGISSHDIDQVKPSKLGPRTLRVKLVILKLIQKIDIRNIFREIAPRWMLRDLTNYQWTLAQVMGLWRQATNHFSKNLTEIYIAIWLYQATMNWLINHVNMDVNTIWSWYLTIILGSFFT